MVPQSSAPDQVVVLTADGSSGERVQGPEVFVVGGEPSARNLIATWKSFRSPTWQNPRGAIIDSGRTSPRQSGEVWSVCCDIATAGLALAPACLPRREREQEPDAHHPPAWIGTPWPPDSRARAGKNGHRPELMQGKPRKQAQRFANIAGKPVRLLLPFDRRCSCTTARPTEAAAASANARPTHSSASNSVPVSTGPAGYDAVCHRPREEMPELRTGRTIDIHIGGSALLITRRAVGMIGVDPPPPPPPPPQSWPR